MAKIKMQKSTADHKLTKNANVILKRGRKPLTEDEKNPESRFIRIAGMRLAKMLKLSKNLRNCADTNMYKYTDEQVSKMFRLIRNSIDRTEAVYTEAKMPKGTVIRKVSKLENPLA